MPGDVVRSVRGARLARAFLLAPLAAPLTYWLLDITLALLDPNRRMQALHNPLRSLVVEMAFGAPVAWAAALVSGVPALWLTRRTGFTPARILPFGLLGGMATSLILAPRLRGDLITVPLPLWEGALLGALASLVWWRMALDRSTGPVGTHP